MKRTMLTTVLVAIVLATVYPQDSLGLVYRISETIDVPVEELQARIAELNKTIATSPRNDILYFERGGCYNDLEMFEEALNDFNYAISLRPGNAEYYFMKANTNNALGKHNEALSDVNRAISLSPENVLYIITRGMVYNSMGKYQEAANDLTTAINFGNIQRGVYFGRGYANAQLDKLDEAISDMTKEIELYPGYFLINHFRTELYIRQGKFDEALADIASLWAITPREMVFAIYTLRAWAYSMLGKWQEALQDANRAIGLNPVHPSMYINRGQIYATLCDMTADRREKAEYERLSKEDYAMHDKLIDAWAERFGGESQ
jgi:tetratricopeptide (TPR) repeat protein